MAWTRDEMAARAAKELQDGFYVNLGIGLPTQVAHHLAPGVSVYFQSENGLIGMLPLQLIDENRMIKVWWDNRQQGTFMAAIQIEALDRSGLLSDVTRVLSEHHVNILSATVNTSSDRLALSRFVFEMGDATHLDRILNAVRRIDTVYDVYRVSDG